MAFYADTLKKAWDYPLSANGLISSLTCGSDLDSDGTQDCAVVTVQPVSTQKKGLKD